MDNVTIRLTVDTKRVLDEFFPHIELSMKEGLLTADEAAKILVTEVLSTLRVETIVPKP